MLLADEDPKTFIGISVSVKTGRHLSLGKRAMTGVMAVLADQL